MGLGSALEGLGALGSGSARTPWSRQPASLPVARASAWVWTPEQEEVLACASSRLQVEALAGTGKTQLLVEFARRRSSARFRYLVFNTAMRDAVQGQLPPNVQATTIHGLAYSRYGAPCASKAATPWSWTTLGLDPALPLSWQAGGAALVRATLDAFMVSKDPVIDASHVPDDLWRIWQAWDVAASWWADREAVADTALSVWRRMLHPADPCPTVPEAWVKQAQLAQAVWPADGWLLDEAQDCTPAMLDWLHHQPGLQVTAGDPHQALYGWRSPLAWGRQAPDPSVRVFPLTGSFRFGPVIAEAVNATLARMGAAHRTVGLGPDGTLTVDPPAQASTLLARTQAGAWAHARRAATAGYAVGTMPSVPERWQCVAALYRNDRAAVRDPWVAGFSSYAALREAAEQWGDASWLRACRWAEHPPAPLTGREGGVPVSALTVHQAKGQTLERVWIARDLPLPEGPVPAWTESDHENARVVYVALSRARTGVHLDPAWAERWQAWCRRQPMPKALETVLDDGF